MADWLRPVLVVMALPEEAQGLFVAPSVDVVFTGIGKVNASYRLTRALMQRRALGTTPELVLNFGTAGSPCHPTGTLLECTGFVQRDMDVRGLGFALGQTPFEDVAARLEFPRRFSELPLGTCASADRFETVSETLSCDAIDMEAYALAKVCHLERIRFACVKYISDGADQNAATDWAASLPRAASAFWKLYQQAAAQL